MAKSLFEVPARPGRAQDSKIVKKSNSKVKKTVSTIRGGNDLIGRIKEISIMVEQKLGEYRDKSCVITERDELRRYFDSCSKNRVISIDTETTGLDPMEDKIVGLCIYTPDELPAYIPINHISYVTGIRSENQLTEEQVGVELRALLLTSNPRVIMFNANFDMRVIRHQLRVNEIYCSWDCYLGAKVLNENEEHSGLKALHKKYVLDGVGDAFSFDALFNGISFDHIPIKSAFLYAAHDAIITYELYEFQRKYLRLDHEREDMRNLAWVFFNIEMPCVPVVCDMEDVGVRFDFEYNEFLKEKYHKLLEDRIAKFNELCGMYEKEISAYRRKTGVDCKLDDPINIKSPSQLSILFFDVMKCKAPVDRRTKKEVRSTKEEVLKELDNPVAQAVLDYREFSTIVDTFIDKLPECVKNDGRIHCKFNQYGARTGRFSSEDPNMQNIPSHNKDIRKMFVASDGYVLMSADYSQQEPKVMTQMCGDPKMIEAYKKGKDLYAEIASLSFNTTYENCLEFRPDGTTNPEGKSRRTQAKSILLGVLYGRGVPSIAEQLGTSTKKAQMIKDSVFKGFPAIPKFEKDSLAMAQELGYVTTLWGRKRRLPDLQLPEYEFRWQNGVPQDSDILDFDDFMNEPVDEEVPEDRQNYYLRKLERAYFREKRKIFEEANEEGIWIVDNGAKIADAERQCVNARIQGSAADMSKLAMILVGNDERLKELGFRLLIPVHDELIAECPEENVKECSERLARLMAEAAQSKLTIPIKCDVSVTKEWYGDELKV